jgi:hypothetical protein
MPSSLFRRLAVALSLTVVLLVTGFPLASTASAAVPRIDLRVLVVTNGAPEVEALSHVLARSGVPTTVIELQDPARPLITSGFLADTVGGVERAKYQGVVLPDEQPAGLAPEELEQLHEFERHFGIRQINASVQARPSIGLNEPFDGGYVGPFDGQDAFLTEAAKAGDFGYAHGRVPFGNETPDQVDNWVEISTPLPGFQPLLTAEIPGSPGRTGVLAGVLQRDDREELSLTFSYDVTSLQLQVLAPGLVRWLTKGTHFGFVRSYFAVHIDDIFMPNARWISEYDCISGVDCPDAAPQRPVIRMTPADVAYAVDWQRRNSFRFDLAYNGAGSVAAAPHGHDPLTAALVEAKDEFGWINHTWSHLYLGCVRDYSVTPWQCAELPILGWTRYVSSGRIQYEILQNIEFAQRHGLPINPTELVTGEHGGLRAPPQMEEDNPELASALTATGVLTLASDASGEGQQRAVGSALTVPRHPINLNYSAGTVAETVDHYNWARTSVADGGSGHCERDSSCVEPVDPTTGFASVVVPREANLALSHVLANDPRPHYAHQSQMAEGRTIYPVVERVLETYRELFTETRPLLTPTMTQSRRVLARQANWAAALRRGEVEGWIKGGVVTVRTDAPVTVPLTTPPGTTVEKAGGALFGEPYGGQQSAWLSNEGVQRFMILSQDPT